jgi:hypothetical protein
VSDEETMTTKKTTTSNAAAIRARDAVRKLFDRKRDELKRLRTDGTKSWDRQWELVDEILSTEPPLWSGHYRNEAAFIASELPGETLRSVRRNVLVAAAFAPSDEKAHGVNKLEEIVLYLMAQSRATEKLRAVDLSRVVIRVPEGKGTREVRAADATVQEVRAARRALGTGASKRKSSPFEKALRTALGTRGPLKSIAITASRDAVRFGAIPRDQLVAFAKALAKAKLPKDAE